MHEYVHCYKDASSTWSNICIQSKTESTLTDYNFFHHHLLLNHKVNFIYMQVKIDFIVNESNWNSRGINKAVGFSFIYIVLGSISFFLFFLVWKNVIIGPTKPFFCLKDFFIWLYRQRPWKRVILHSWKKKCWKISLNMEFIHFVHYRYILAYFEFERI